MTQEAYDLFGQALSERHARNEARRIRIRVHEARGNPHPASVRWPVELLQNALDSGPRSGNTITVRIHCEPSKLIFEHDGAPFTSDELAALLTGGSSKEFESEVTTGRFGTGFLVTHVLAERATLRGLLTVSRGWELFELALDRSGDEDAILANSRSCNEALRHASPVKDFAGIPSARFEYPIVDDRTVQIGLETLKQALPYLYGTRRSLGKVEFTAADGSTEIWSPGEVVEEAVEDGYVQYRTIDVVRGGDEYLPIRVYRFMTAENSAAAALVLVEESGDGWEVLLPEDDAPKIYREYPLRGSRFVPTNFVFDGKFDPDQERIRLLMSDEDKELLEDAFAAGVVAAKYAFSEGWEDASRYVLCVVDLRDVPEAELDGEWTAERIEKLANISSDIGASVKETCELVDTARTNDVAIRNDAALRYEVPVSMWEDGISITEWVELIRQSQKQRL